MDCHGSSIAVQPYPFLKSPVKTGRFFPEGLVQDDFIDIQAVICRGVNMVTDLFAEIEKILRLVAGVVFVITGLYYVSIFTGILE